MLKKFYQVFSNLPESNKAMVYLMWIYAAGDIITWIFINIYVFKLHNSLAEALVYNIIFFTSTFVWFSGVGYLMSFLQKDIKNMYYVSYLLFILAFVEMFLFQWSLFASYLFGLIYAFWYGAFWNAVHTQELKNVEGENRDFYSSSISAGRNIISIIIPLFVALIFYMTTFFVFDGYFVLFLILPLIYALSFFFIKDIRSYIPTRVTKGDFLNFFNLKKYKYGHLYFFIDGIISSLVSVVLPIVSILLLKNETNIWLFQWGLTIVSTFLVVHLSHKRNENNRLKYFFIISVFMCLNFLILWLSFCFVTFVVFSLVWLFLNPLFRVSEHVYDLSLMDNIKTPNSDFYPAMILREILLWAWRILALLVLLFLSWYTRLTLIEVLQQWLIFAWLFTIMLSWTLYLWEKYEKHLV